MKTISLNVPEGAYEEMRAIAAVQGRSAAELIRQAMTEFLIRERRHGRSVFDLPALDLGRPLTEVGGGSSEVFDEMIDR